MTTLLKLTDSIAADLISDELAPDYRAGLAAFEPLVGSWDLRYTYRRAGGGCLEGTGYANFGWGLRGTALVDIWAFDSAYAGTTIRFYDPTIDRIRSTWICPARNLLVPFIGRAVEGKIVLNAMPNDPPGRRVRWTFVEIARETFSWTGEICDDGSTWLHVQEIEGRRRP
jgi:hypothetical protein